MKTRMEDYPIAHLRNAQQRAVASLKADHMTLGDISDKYGLAYSYTKLVMGNCDITVRRGSRFTQLYRRDRVEKIFEPMGYL